MERGMSYKRNVVVYIGISLDGYIATKDDSLEWLLNTQGSGDNGFGEFYDTVETIIMRKRTYDWIMNQEWSELNKTMQLQLKKKDSFEAGISTLLELRKALMEQILQFKEDLSPEDFTAMPYPNANGYHSKTIAYSLWHIFRIEDIVAHSLIADDEQVFFREDYQRRINSPIITTGNELAGKEFGIAACGK